MTALPFALAVALAAVRDTPRTPVRPVAEVDLARYAGRWYEVARFPNWFQKKCVAETTADYTLLPDGRIRVVNACRTAEGKVSTAEGVARVAGSTSTLKVRFAPRWLSALPFVWGDYWILDLTPDYGAALVGSPDRRYLWILARTPKLDEATYARLVAAAAAQGFDVQRLVRSPAQAAPWGPRQGQGQAPDGRRRRRPLHPARRRS